MLTYQRVYGTQKHGRFGRATLRHQTVADSVGGNPGGSPIGVGVPSPAEDAMPGSVAAMSTGSGKSQTRYRTLEMERWGL